MPNIGVNGLPGALPPTAEPSRYRLLVLLATERPGYS